MITDFENFKLITENPDTIWDNEERRYVTDKDARPFFITPNKDHSKVKRLFVGNLGSFHSDLTRKEEYWDEKYYPGRMWIKSKLITFWTYPNEELFKQIINRIQRKLKIKMYHNGWRIEVLKSDNKISKGQYNPLTDEYTLIGDNPNKCEYALVPLEDYAGSDDIPEEIQIMHLMNWKEKELAKQVGKLQFGKWGSKLTALDQPYNIRYRQAIRTSENKKF